MRPRTAVGVRCSSPDSRASILPEDDEDDLQICIVLFPPPPHAVRYGKSGVTRPLYNLNQTNYRGPNVRNDAQPSGRIGTMPKVWYKPYQIWCGLLARI